MFPWAPLRSTKAAIKLHTLLDLRGAIPSFIHISDVKLGDVNVFDLLVLETGAFYVMGRAYLDFERLHALAQMGAFVVAQAKSTMRVIAILRCRASLPAEALGFASHYSGCILFTPETR